MISVPDFNSLACHTMRLPEIEGIVELRAHNYEPRSNP
jgi:hypothetical protein